MLCMYHHIVDGQVPQSAKLYGLPKVHKPNIPMQPIVSFCGSPTYQLHQALNGQVTRTTSLMLSKRYKYQTTTSLYPSMSNHFSPAYHFDLPLTVLRPPSTNHTTNRHYPLHLCLSSTYFQYNGKHYKKLHGTAMGSPVSIVVAEIVMQNIEEQALATYSETLPLWLCYTDNTITAVHKN